MSLYKDYRPKTLKEFFGSRNLIESLEAITQDVSKIPHALLLTGSSGCLRGDTLIFDPIDKSNKTVRERCEKGLPFHVISYSSDGIVVGTALPPVRFPEEKMFRVETSESVFFVTYGHRFLLNTGEYSSLKELVENGYDGVRLLSTLGTCQEVQLLNESHYLKIGLDSQDDYPHGLHSYDEQLQFLSKSDLTDSPSLNDVHEHSPNCLPLDVQDNEEEHIQISQLFFPHSKNDSFHQNDVFFPQSKCLSSAKSGKSHFSHNEIIEQALFEFSLSGKVAKSPHPVEQINQNQIPLNFCSSHKHLLASSSSTLVITDNNTFSSTIIKSITEISQEEYFDFHVLLYNNYWSGGIFHHNCGKTTIARIIKDILKCHDMDYTELDAATYRSIDDVRDIRRQMNMKPIAGPVRVWLLDECFAKGTKIRTISGETEIETLSIGDVIHSLNGNAKIENIFQNKVGLDRIMKLTFSDGSTVFTTKQHQFFTDEGWIEAQNLTKENSLTFSYSSNIMNSINSENKELINELRKMWERRAWWQWKINTSTDSSFNSVRMENRNCDWFKDFAIWLSNKLQSRYWKRIVKICNRSGWSFASIEKSYIKRCKKDGQVKRTWLESSEIYQQGSNDESFRSIIEDKERNQGFVTFFDLQIEGHPSYFANGLPVHNCHMLGTGGSSEKNAAQNALLKALEDMPPHVYFILATTEPQMLLKTIKTRCMEFNFPVLSERLMSKLLRDVATKEGKSDNVSDEILALICKESLGSPRAALVALEKVIDLSPNQQAKAVERASSEENQAIELCRALIAGKEWKAISTIISGLQEQQAESVRRMVLGYCQSVLLKSDNPRAFAIIREFQYNTYDSGWPQLTAACYACVEIGK